MRSTIFATVLLSTGLSKSMMICVRPAAVRARTASELLLGATTTRKSRFPVRSFGTAEVRANAGGPFGVDRRPLQRHNRPLRALSRGGGQQPEDENGKKRTNGEIPCMERNSVFHPFIANARSRETYGSISRAQLLLAGGKDLVPLVGCAGGIALLLLGILYSTQEKLLYMPEVEGLPRSPRDNPAGYRSPEEYGIPFEEHHIKTEDGVSIHSWLLLHQQSPQKRRPTLIFFHGNAGNIGIRLPNSFQMFTYLDCNVLMVEYRGYGDSDDARIDEEGLKRDAEAALKFARGHPSIDPERIVVFGRSLGGAVGFHLAQHAEAAGAPLAGLIVENAFVSIDRMVDAVLPALSPVKQLVLRMHWNSAPIAAAMSTPVLYLAGSEDEIVPHEQMLELYEKSQSGSSRLAMLHVIDGGTHNETWIQGGALYWKRIRDFFDALFR